MAWRDQKWFAGLGQKSKQRTGERMATPPQLRAEFQGSWIAVRHGEVIFARETPYELVADLRAKKIIDATILRVPGVNEPELVGLG